MVVTRNSRHRLYFGIIIIVLVVASKISFSELTISTFHKLPSSDAESHYHPLPMTCLLHCAWLLAFGYPISTLSPSHQIFNVSYSSNIHALCHCLGQKMNTILNLYSTFSFSFPNYDIKTLSFPKLLRTMTSLQRGPNIESFKNNAFEFEFHILIFFYVTFYLNIYLSFKTFFFSWNLFYYPFKYSFSLDDI